MTDNKTTQNLKNIVTSYNSFQSQKDEQSLFYINQMIDLLNNELKIEVIDDKALDKILLKDFKNTLNSVFNNMKDYLKKILDNSIGNINQILSVATYNKYVDINNIKSIYAKFKEEMDNNLKIKTKIDIIISANTRALIESIQSITTIENNNKISEIVFRYISFIQNELIKNATDKCEYIVKSYKSLIDSILSELQTDKDKIQNMNINLINNTASVYLKEQEYIIINKYMDHNFKYINDIFTAFEKEVFEKLGIRKENKIINSAKDYLLGFNNTISVKIRKVFDEMNDVLNLDNTKANNKINEFSDKISKVYEMPLVFDKELSKYKKDFDVPNKAIDSFNIIYNKFKEELTKNIKQNIANIFRDNLKIYNAMIYKTMVIKSKIGEYNTVLSADKVKDLLFK